MKHPIHPERPAIPAIQYVAEVTQKRVEKCQVESNQTDEENQIRRMAHGVHNTPSLKKKTIDSMNFHSVIPTVNLHPISSSYTNCQSILPKAALYHLKDPYL
jgi:hypothetical protein